MSFIKQVTVAALCFTVLTGLANAEHIRSDGKGGYYTQSGKHIRSDGKGGYYTPEGKHIRSDNKGGYLQLI